MKIRKGMKLTDEQKAQRKASRQRNKQAWLERYEQRRIEEAKRRDEEEFHHQEVMASMKAEIARLKAESAYHLQIIVNLKTVPEVKVALEYFRKTNWPHDPELSLDRIAFFLLKIALAHPEQLQIWIGALENYRVSEGYEPTGDSISKILNGRIAGRKEYRPRAKA